jgi:hypothetical protein
VYLSPLEESGVIDVSSLWISTKALQTRHKIFTRREEPFLQLGYDNTLIGQLGR